MLPAEPKLQRLRFVPNRNYIEVAFCCVRKAVGGVGPGRSGRTLDYFNGDWMVDACAFLEEPTITFSLVLVSNVVAVAVVRAEQNFP